MKEVDTCWDFNQDVFYQCTTAVSFHSPVPQAFISLPLLSFLSLTGNELC